MPDATGQSPEAPADAFEQYYQACVERWSDPRYALDKHFVQLTLLLDQGEEVQGPRWQPARETFSDLRDVLAHVPNQALVVLGPPGSGKSTLLRHCELDVAQAALAGQAGDDLSVTPLTFFMQLYDYKPARPDSPLPSPMEWLTARWAAQYPDLPDLETVLRAGRLTVLLDALNEIPYAGAEPVRLSMLTIIPRTV